MHALYSQIARNIALKENFKKCIRDDEDFIVYKNNQNGYLAFNQHQMDVLAEDIIMLMKELPVKESDRRIAFLVDDFFIGNTSGVFTFIKHFTKMCANFNCVLDLIVDTTHDTKVPDKFDTSNVSYFYSTGFKDINNLALAYTLKYETRIRPEIFSNTFSEYLEKFKPLAVVSHSFPSTIALSKLKPTLDKQGIKCLAYTHIGDIMDPNNSSMLDFGNEITTNYIRLLKNTSLPIGTQTEASLKALKKITLDQEIILLPEPFYEAKTMYQSPSGSRGVLIIASNYERKRFDLMFEILAITGLPVTVVCGQDKNRKNNKTIREMAMEAGVQGYRQIDNFPNDLLPDIIRSHRVLLHLSEIEVMPYAILEASSHIPCIVNKKAPYTDGLPCPVIKIDPDDMYESVSTIIEAYGDTFEYRALDVRSYTDESEKLWTNFLGI